VTDTSTHKPIQVSSDAATGPYIMLPLSQVEQVHKVLEENDIPHWVDHHAVSVNGQPAVTMIYIRKGIDPHHAQALLDAAA
jgi:hypothetical protein